MALTFTYQTLGPVVQVIATWTSDGSGDAAATTVPVVHGRLIKAITDPGAVAPTADYDIVITDEQAVNVLGGCQDDLIDRHTSTTEEEYFLLLDDAGTPLAQSLHPVVANKLTVTVSNAGASKNGVLYLYIEGTLQGVT